MINCLIQKVDMINLHAHPKVPDTARAFIQVLWQSADNVGPSTPLQKRLVFDLLNETFRKC